MHKGFSTFSMLLVLAAAVCGQSVDPLDQGIKIFREGYLEWSAAKMEAGLQLIEKAPPDAVSCYWQSVAQFHLMLCRNATDSPKTVRLLEQAVCLNPRDAESSMMLAVLYGRQIAEKPFRALWLGRKIKTLREMALTCGAGNPRVQSLAGTCWFEAPAPFGNREVALEHLKAAAELYEAEQTADRDVRQPRWGAAECYARLGDLMVEKGDIAQARLYYQSALRMNPLYKPAQRSLMELNDEREK